MRVLSVYPGRTVTLQLEALDAAHGDVDRPELLLPPHDVALAVLNALTLPPAAEITDLRVRPMQKRY